MGAKQTNLGAMLRLFMTVGDISTRNLAPRIGISAATLNRIVNGGQMDTETFLKLTKWLLS